MQTITCIAAVHKPQEFLSNIRGAPNEGELIIQHFCADCHASDPLIRLGAPRISHVSDWKSRVHQGFESLMKHVFEGFNAMPSRGGCFECSDEQLLLAVKAMLPKKYSDEIPKKID